MKTIILDTDIGTDIDDSWALAYLLRCPDLQPELILTATGDTRYRAALAARLLQQAGRLEVPVGIGRATFSEPPIPRTLLACIQDFSLDESGVTVYGDGIAQAIRVLEDHDEVTVIAIGSFTNIAEICRLRPDLIRKIRLIAMAGSIHRNFRGELGKIAEYNINLDIPSAQVVFSAPWKNFVLTPLDHCGNLILSSLDYQRVVQADTPLTGELIYQYHAWLRYNRRPTDGEERESSILYDTAAIHLARTTEDSNLRNMNLEVDDQGYLIESPAGHPVEVAMSWKDHAGFLRKLSEVLAGRCLEHHHKGLRAACAF